MIFDALMYSGDVRFEVSIASNSHLQIHITTAQQVISS